jgi:hypothetical protein
MLATSRDCTEMHKRLSRFIQLTCRECACKIHGFRYVITSRTPATVSCETIRGIAMKRVRGENMRFEYYVLGAVALIVVAAGVTMLPDFIRYMKIRSM